MSTCGAEDVVEEEEITTEDDDTFALSTQCVHCHCEPSAPKLLSCLHTVCESPCAELCVWATERVVRCPLCSHDTALPPTGVRALPCNALPKREKEERSAMEADGEPGELLCEECTEEEATPAVARCVECKPDILLCRFHVKSHRKSRRTARHNPVEDLERSGPETSVVQCSLHPGKTPTAFCENCGKLICDMCDARGEHSAHTTTSIAEAAGPIRERLRTLSAATEEDLDSIKAAELEAKSALEAVDENARKQSRKIEQESNTLRNSLKDVEDKLLDKVDDLRRKRAEPLEKQQEMLHEASRRLKTAVCLTKRSVEKLEDIELVEVAGTLEAIFKQAPGIDRRRIDRTAPVVYEAVGVEELSKAIRVGIGAVEEEMPVVAKCSTRFAHPKDVVKVIVCHKPDSSFEVSKSDIEVCSVKPDGSKVPLESIETQGLPTNIWMVCAYPASRPGKVSIWVKADGRHATGSPMKLEIVRPPPTFEVDFRESVFDRRHVEVGDEYRTARCTSYDGSADVLITPGFRRGVHRWKVKMADFNSSSGQLCGVANVTDYGNPNDCVVRAKFGCARWGGELFLDGGIAKGSLPAWNKGDVLSFELDCAERTLKIVHIDTQTTAEISQLPRGELFAYFNLYRPPDAVTLLN